MINIYDYFNSRDIAAHCRKIDHTFTATETAYLIWHSNHHTLADKHKAWREVINSLPDEDFHSSWYDSAKQTLHSFLEDYMHLQSEFIEDFCETKENHIYTYSTLPKYHDQYCSANIAFDSYKACLEALRIYELRNDIHDEIAKVMITRQKVYSTAIALREAQMPEHIIFDKHLEILDIEPDFDADGKRLFAPIHGFYDMWVVIPTPFCKGDIVADVNTYVDGTQRHLPFILDRIPYWKKGAVNGIDSWNEANCLLHTDLGWTDMQEGVLFQDGKGEIYWDHAFHYLNLEYYRDELKGMEKLLRAVSDAIQGKITMADLLKSHSVTLMEQHIKNVNR